jgi:flagellar biosynthetic protein FliR
MVKSFQIVDFGTMGNVVALTEHISGLFTYMFDLSLRLAAPLLVMLLLLTVALGFIARTVPQMNIMVVGFPLQIAVGFVFLILLVPFLAEIFTGLWDGFVGQLETVIRIMRTT